MLCVNEHIKILFTFLMIHLISSLCNVLQTFDKMWQEFKYIKIKTEKFWNSILLLLPYRLFIESGLRMFPNHHEGMEYINFKETTLKTD